MTSKQITQMLEQQSGNVTSKMIKDLIESNQAEQDRRYSLWQEYVGDVPILKRKFDNPDRINNKIPFPFRNYIVQQSVGYFLGNSINYGINESKYNELQMNAFKSEMDSFKFRNNIEDLDNELGEHLAVCGVGYRLCYVDTEGRERIMNIKPWEAIVIKDSTLDEVQYGIIHYPIEIVDDSGKKTVRTKVEWYDGDTVTYFIEDSSGEFQMDYSQPVNPQPHLFDYVPLIEFSNNSLQQGDFELVSGIIDEYDKTMSNMSNELDEFNLSYMIFRGMMDLSSEELSKIKAARAANVPTDGGVEFLTKQVDADFVENHKKSLKEDLFMLSSTVNMSDESFSGGNQSGESRKWKLLSLENRTANKERKYTKALRQMFRVICSVWNKKSVPLSYEDVTYQFTRNLPVELLNSAEFLAKFGVSPSKKTLFENTPFIKDANAELEQINAEQEQDTAINLDKIQLPTVDMNNMMKQIQTEI